MLALAIYWNVWSDSSALVDRNLSIFCDLPFADPTPKTYIAGEVMGLGFFALIKSLDFDISIIYN